MRRIIYRRVSSDDQSTNRQLDGVCGDAVFEDKQSGKDLNRPEFQRMLAFAVKGDLILVHSMDRLSRSLEDLLRTVRTLNERGIAIEFVQDRLRFSGDNHDPISVLMLHILGAVAQFERAMIRSRQAQGIAAAKARGTYAKKLTDKQIGELRAKAAAGVPKVVLQKQYGIAKSTLWSYLQ